MAVNDIASSISIDPQLATLLGHNAVPAAIARALEKSAGARFYRCALQVNPFEYSGRHDKNTTYKTEQEYNAAIVAACMKEDVEVVGITDHFRISTSINLAEALRAGGIFVFLGFEASSSEGVHILCLFPCSVSAPELERIIGACGVTDSRVASPNSDKTCEQLLELIPEMGGITIAAHACGANGLLTTLKGQARARIWCRNDLLAIALPGPRAGCPENYRNIIGNKDPTFLRRREIAVVNANDVSDPAALSGSSATTLIKMASPSLEGLRQAFLDWESRIRLNSDAEPPAHTEIIAVAWAGGLLDGQCLHFNESLNVLVGGRGAGKSTLIESLRYAFELTPRGIEAAQTHTNIIKSLLGQGATVSVLIRSPLPSPQYYLVERIYGSRARVRNQQADLLGNVNLPSILGIVEVYGQHEISELTRYPDKLAQLLRRFTEPATDTTAPKTEMRDKLEESRRAILGEVQEISRIDDALAALPTLREHLKRFADAGLDDKLKQKTAIDREARIFEGAEQLVVEAREVAQGVVDRSSAEKLVGDTASDLLHGAILAQLDEVQSQLLSAIKSAGEAIGAAVEAAVSDLRKVKDEWRPHYEAAEQRYQKTVQELRAEGHDATKYVSFQDQVERLKPKETERERRAKRLAQLQKDRRELLAGWDSLKAEDFRALKRAAQRVSRRLKDRVRVKVRRSASLGELESILRTHCSGNISQALERLRGDAALNVTDLAADILEGAQRLIKTHGFSQSSAERIAQGGMNLALEVEECEIVPEAVLQLNVGSGATPVWRELDQLSTGQKATAVLLLLLLESDAPLIVDQPEDDLDNHFIADCIVPAMRGEKQKRQFVFSTHNANIPVLGDAEQIVGLTPVVDDAGEHSTVPDDLCGSIDMPKVKDLVKDLLEGGQEAFEFRQQKYGF